MNLNTIGTLFSQTPLANTDIRGVCIDSRIVQPGYLFIAIAGEHVDGHDFLQEVQAKGAVAAIVSRIVPDLSLPQLLVADPLWALAQIADLHRQEINCPVIALTGSNGKTTVKEMIAACLPQPSLATRGNLNNHIGAPLSVLELRPEHRYAVFELGANHQGEIAHTVAIAKPDVSLINNIAPAHVQGFGSIEGVASAKGEIHQGLSPNGTAVINIDDEYAHFWDQFLKGQKVLRFSRLQAADVYTQDLRLDAQGNGQFTLIGPQVRAEIRLNIPGLHNVSNALAAATCCLAVGISIEEIQKGLNHFTGVKGRLTFLSGKNQCTIIDDSYNANLRSVLTALDVLSHRQGKKILVFGDMGELGDYTLQHHEEVGRVASQLGIDQLMSYGVHSVLASQAFGINGQHFSSQEELVFALVKELGSETTVLVKGSRSSAMEKIVNQVLQ